MTEIVLLELILQVIYFLASSGIRATVVGRTAYMTKDWVERAEACPTCLIRSWIVRPILHRHSMLVPHLSAIHKTSGIYKYTVNYQ